MKSDFSSNHNPAISEDAEETREITERYKRKRGSVQIRYKERETKRREQREGRKGKEM